MGLEHWSGALVRWRDTAEIAPAPDRFFGARKHLQSFFAVAFCRRRRFFLLGFIWLSMMVGRLIDTGTVGERGGTRERACVGKPGELE